MVLEHDRGAHPIAAPAAMRFALRVISIALKREAFSRDYH